MLRKVDDPNQRHRIEEGISRVMSDRRAVALRKIKGQEGKWRLKVGCWRVILEVQEDKSLAVLDVGHRREIYRHGGARL